MTATIAAVASGFGRAAIAIIRLSGPSTARIVGSLLSGGLPPPRRASLRRLVDPQDGSALDQAIVLWMPGPTTFTGEDQAELHVHGGGAVRTAVLRALTESGCRIAEAGEFTRRAFLNGRLDLTAVEGLADLIDAETEAQRRQAVRQLDGALSRHVAAWREQLLDALALAEAALDFSDEEDVSGDGEGVIGAAVEALRVEVAAVLAGAAQGERLRDGLTIVIAGPPNAGKSTLLNALARRDVAIVSPTPGTTRDAIEVRCDLGGLPVTFVDTAGLRDSDDVLEREGIARTGRQVAMADMVLWLEPAYQPSPEVPAGIQGPSPVFRLRTKIDLLAEGTGAGGDLAVSAATGAGMGQLLARIQDEASGMLASGGEALVTRERHRLILVDLLACLDRAASLRDGVTPELVAEDLRLAARALGRLTGQVDVEHVLDRIFSSFCIGK